MDFSNWKCHASSMGLLMTDPKGKSNIDKYNDVFAEWVISNGKKEEMERAGKTSLKTYASLCLKIGNLNIQKESLGKIKDEIELSETAKSHLVECYVKTKYGRTKDVETDAMIKGTKMEEEGITVLSRVHKTMYRKN